MELPEMSDTNRLAEIAIDEIVRRLKAYDEAVRRLNDVESAMERAAQLIDFAADRELKPKEYEGPMRTLYRQHRQWIEAQRARGRYPALITKAPAARPKRNSKR
jgi:hypothetical protein